jgi:hypothetical protein
MKKNVGTIDKIVRIALAALIAGAGIYYQSWFGLVAIVPLATALIGNCPLYSIVGISTCPIKHSKAA